jgi:hypothetical protein
MIGRTIEIYLPDANSMGVRVCSIKDSIVNAVVVPRSKIGDVQKREEMQAPGIYFLIGEEVDGAILKQKSFSFVPLIDANGNIIEYNFKHCYLG